MYIKERLLTESSFLYIDISSSVVFLRLENVFLLLNEDLYTFLLNSNERSSTLVEIYEALMFGNYPFGIGLNQNFPYNLVQDEAASFSLGHIFLKSFGLIGSFVFYLLSFSFIYKFRRSVDSWLLIFVLSAIVNSSQGLLVYGMWFATLGRFLKFKKHDSIIKFPNL